MNSTHTGNQPPPSPGFGGKPSPSPGFGGKPSPSPGFGGSPAATGQNQFQGNLINLSKQAIGLSFAENVVPKALFV